MKLILNLYFRKPILYDYIISIIVISGIVLLVRSGLVNLPDQELVKGLLTDLSNTSFTSTGFILTILTVLITFKANGQKKEKISSYDSALSIFFETSLYSATTGYLKNCIKSLLLVALIGYLLKAFWVNFELKVTFYLSIYILTILTLTLFRCILILGKVLKLQNS